MTLACMQLLRPVSLLSLRGLAWNSYSTVSASTAPLGAQLVKPKPDAAGTVDPFTSRLQHRTEQDLAHLGRLEPKPNASDDEEQAQVKDAQTGEHGGPKGPEPTRYGDWERSGRCYDF